MLDAAPEAGENGPSPAKVLAISALVFAVSIGTFIGLVFWLTTLSTGLPETPPRDVDAAERVVAGFGAASWLLGAAIAPLFASRAFLAARSLPMKVVGAVVTGIGLLFLAYSVVFASTLSVDFLGR